MPNALLGHVQNHFRTAVAASGFAASGQASAVGESVLSNDLKRLATFAPYGIGAGVVIGGGIGALTGLKSQRDEETKGQAAWRGARKGMTWGAITGLVIGVAGHPPVSVLSKKVSDADKALRGLVTEGASVPGFSPGEALNDQYVRTLRRAARLGSTGEILESVGLLGGASGAKVSAILDGRKLETETDPEKRRQLKNSRAAKNIISMYLFFRVIGKRGKNISSNFPDLMETRAPDIAGAPANLFHKLFTNPRDLGPMLKRIFTGFRS